MQSSGSAVANKKILLFDTDRKRRDGRADKLRVRGIEVICASDVLEARMFWRETSYRLVLVDTADSPEAVVFSREIRNSKPKQLVAFFVGKPDYLAGTPLAIFDGDISPDPEVLFGDRLEEACEKLEQRNGFQEAALRMLAVRHSKQPMGSSIVRSKLAGFKAKVPNPSRLAYTSS